MIMFDIHKRPATEQQLGREREAVVAKMRKFELAMLPVLVLAVAIGYALIHFLYPDDSDPEFLQSAVRAVTTGITLAALPLAPWFYFYERLLAIYKQLEELPLEVCEQALKLADEHSELERYRVSVVSQRSMVMGDLLAMQAYASTSAEERAAEADRAKAEADRAKADAARAALHRATPRPASNDSSHA